MMDWCGVDAVCHCGCVCCRKNCRCGCNQICRMMSKIKMQRRKETCRKEMICRKMLFASVYGLMGGGLAVWDDDEDDEERISWGKRFTNLPTNHPPVQDEVDQEHLQVLTAAANAAAVAVDSEHQHDHGSGSETSWSHF